MTANLEDLFAPVGPEFDAEEALAEWRWLVPQRVTTLAVTAFGDAFLVSEDGSVYFLDTAAGQCAQVAASPEAWNKAIREPEKLDEWCMPALLILLREAGIRLSEGQCYSPLRSVILGGSFTVENWAPQHWRVHFAASGQLHQAIRKFPPGTKITDLKFTPM